MDLIFFIKFVSKITKFVAMNLEYVKKKIEFYQDFPIEGVEYIDLNPIYKDSKARDLLVDKCIELIDGIDYIAPNN